MSITTIITVLLIISFLVVIHELGHFWAAKKNGVRVEEFGIGYPPRLFGKKFGETIYSFNLIPFGGFVSITGEDELDEGKQEKIKNDPNSFSNKSPWQKIQILIAGIIMNFLLAFVLFYIFFFINGFKSFYIPMIFDYDFKFGKEVSYGTMIFDLEKNSPAESAGMKLGEVILKVNGEDIFSVEDLRDKLTDKAGTPVKIETLDITGMSNDRSTYEVTPVAYEPEIEGESNAIIGVYLEEAKSIHYESLLDRVFSGPMHTYNMLGYSMASLGKIIGLSFETRDISPVSSSMTGPVGIFNILGSIVETSGGQRVLNLLNTVAIISLGFAFTNLLPIPALDGGRILFKLYEGITRKKINPRLEANIHKAGMIMLYLLVILITFRNIRVW
jgi:regulator of sigma E protease